MLKYYREKALKDLPESSPFKSLVESTEIPQNTVSYHVNQRSFTCQYYFQQGKKRGLHLSLPLSLTAEQIEDFKNHFKALIRFDKSMRRWREPLDYAFDVPEKKWGLSGIGSQSIGAFSSFIMPIKKRRL